jgi:hypothetical protein
MPSNWGQDFTVGAVPVFKYLESRDIDEVGYTLRTASLMTDPEFFFDDRDPSDYRLFGIRYLILPARDQPPVRARLAMRSGPYWLWTIDGAGYVQAGQIIGEISANRTNIGTRSVRLLRSGLAADGAYLSVGYGSDGDRDSRLPTVASQSSAGAASTERADLDDGEASATVRMRRPGVAVLSASYDPGWTATVTGARRRRRPRGHRPRHVPLPRVRRLPGIARTERPHPRHDRRRAGVRAARKAAPRFSGHRGHDAGGRQGASEMTRL